MSNPTTKVMIGFKALSGMTYIVPLIVGNDMGDHGRVSMPLKTKILINCYAKFVYSSKKNGNCIYKEITEKDFIYE